MSKIEHKIFLKGELIRELENAAVYDTLSPYRMVANFFYDLNQRIALKKKFEIVSKEKKYEINTEQDLRDWIVKVFNSPYNKGFEDYLNKQLD
jgi:hypothetical protein